MVIAGGLFRQPDIGREKLRDENRQKVDKLVERYPGLKGF
jgi:hypothetical protein